MFSSREPESASLENALVLAIPSIFPTRGKRRAVRFSRLFTLSRNARRRRAAGGYYRAMTRMNHARTRIFAHPTRRGLIGLAAGCLATPFSAEGRDQTGELAEQLRSGATLGGAARNIGGALRLPPGVVAIRSLELPPGARLIGAPSEFIRLASTGRLQ